MNKPKTLQPFIRFCMTIGEIPTSYMNSMTYEEQIIWLCNFLEKEVIPVVNNNSEVVKELQNWFENLDVQEEVNNKIEEMYNSGELEEIITQYLQIKGILGFDTIALMKNGTNFIDGSICKTLGSLSYNDGKGNYYKIRTITSSDIVDEINIISLTNFNTLIAELIPDFYRNQIESNINNIESDLNDIELNITSIQNDITSIEEELNIYDIIVASDGSEDYTSVATAVSNATNNQKIYVKNGTYNNEIIDCRGKYLSIIGESKEGVIIQNSTQAYATPVLNIGKGVIKNLTLKENGIADSSNGGYAIHIDNNDLTNNNLLIDNCYLYSGSQSAVGIGLRPNGTIIIKNSELYTEFTRTSSSDNGALFCHTSNEEEGTGQLLKLENCYIHSKNTCAIKLQSCKSSSNIGYLEAYNTSLYSDYYKYKSELLIRELYNNATSHNMLLSPKNSCNTSILNHTKYSNQYDVTFDKFLNDQVEYPIKRKIINDSINGTKTINLSSFENFGNLINVYGNLTETSSGLCIPLFYRDNTNYFELFKHPSGYLSLSSNLIGTFQLIVEYWANT